LQKKAPAIVRITGMSRRTQPPRLCVAPPAAAEEGATQFRALLVPFFGRRDRSGADWSLMLESLFRAGF
jgi:hypothetical protein